MGRAPCCDKANVKKGPWSPEEDAKLKEFIQKFGTGGNWIALPQKVGLKRCGKSCRLRWLNYLRPNIKHGEFSDEEDKLICTLYATIGSRWSIIAAQLPGRTDNDIKNYWNTKLKKKLMSMIHPPPINQLGKFPPPFSGILQNYQPLHNDYNPSFYNFQAAARSLTAFDYQSIISAPPPQNYLYSTNISHDNNSFSVSTTTTTTQHAYYNNQENQLDQGMGDFQYFGKLDNNTNNNMIVFGGSDHQPSCSSSDGSCSQISYGGRDHHVGIKQEEMAGFLVSNNGVEERQKFMLHQNILLDRKPNGIVQQQQCDLDQVKQMIINNSNNGGNSNFMFNIDDENNCKTREKGMYYYYH